MAIRLFLIITVVFVGRCAAYGQKEFDGQRGTQNWPVFSDAPNALYHHIARTAYDQLDDREKQLQATTTLAEWQKRQQIVKKLLRDAVGAFPVKTPLHATVMSKHKKQGYHLENIVFESQPGFYVTSTLFIPEGAKKAPAILYCSGHSDAGYRAKGYINEILNFVKKGFVVFAFDPAGQGERLQYFNAEKNRSRFRWPSYEHSYPGAQLFITGNTLARSFIWDGIRAIDYLLTREEVDARRLGITGRSGGGTQSAYIAAFDDRVLAAAPENYITNMRRLFQAMGPQDAEQNFFNAISKGLDMSDLLMVRAPKPMLVVTTTQDMFPIQGALETCSEVAKVYRAYGKMENFAMVTDDAPHASTRKNREAAYRFFQVFLNNPGKTDEEVVDSLTHEELQVSATGQISTSFTAETVFSLNKKDALSRMERLNAERDSSPLYLSRVLQSAKHLSGFQQPDKFMAPWFTGRIQRKGYVIEKYLIAGEGDYMIPYVVLKPEHPSRKAMLYLNPDGKAVDIEEGGDMEWFVRHGVMVVAPDLVGIGEMGPGEFKGDSYIDSVSYNIWFAGMLTGRSIVGIRAGDIVRIVEQLKTEGVNEIYALAKEQMAPALLHAAAFDKRISRIALIQPYASYRSIVTTQDYNPHFLHSTVAGVIGIYDLPDLEASLAPRRLLIAGTTGAKGLGTKDADILRDLSVVRTAYKNAGSKALEIVAPGKVSQIEDALIRWLASE